MVGVVAEEEAPPELEQPQEQPQERAVEGVVEEAEEFPQQGQERALVREQWEQALVWATHRPPLRFSHFEAHALHDLFELPPIHDVGCLYRRTFQLIHPLLREEAGDVGGVRVGYDVVLRPT